MKYGMTSEEIKTEIIAFLYALLAHFTVPKDLCHIRSVYLDCMHYIYVRGGGTQMLQVYFVRRMNGSLRICAMESTVLVSRVGERI
jgi:hypothetical protein